MPSNIVPTPAAAAAGPNIAPPPVGSTSLSLSSLSVSNRPAPQRRGRIRVSAGLPIFSGSAYISKPDLDDWRTLYGCCLITQTVSDALVVTLQSSQYNSKAILVSYWNRSRRRFEQNSELCHYTEYGGGRLSGHGIVVQNVQLGGIGGPHRSKSAQRGLPPSSLELVRSPERRMDHCA